MRGSTARLVTFPVVRPGVCRVCHRAARTPKSHWCSTGCVALYQLLTNPEALRAAVCDRDHGVCAMPDCRLDCLSLEHTLGGWPRRLRRQFNAKLLTPDRVTYWDADHILPVSQGGGGLGLRNLRTLCVWCHRRRAGGDGTLSGRPPGAVLVPPVLNELRPT